ncbi:TPA: DUF3709 domain-containing protein [Vibrio cholerae]
MFSAHFCSPDCSFLAARYSAFTYRLKVCRQLSIVLRYLMKRQCVCRCKFQCYCLIELSCPCVVSEFVGEVFYIGLVAK